MWKNHWATAALLILLAAVAAVCVHWVFLVPIFQSPDEDQHLDYALALRQHGGLFTLRDRPDCHLELVHPYTRYLVERTQTRAFPFDLTLKVPADYGTAAYFETLDRDRPGPETLAVERPPTLVWVYPYGYYGLLACWLESLFRIRDSLVFAFYGARLFSVLLLMVSLAAIYGTLREMGKRRGFSLWLTGVIGFFPLTTFIGSYVQPDNLSLTLVSLSFYLTLAARRQLDRGWLFVALGAVLGGLLVTKLHYFIVTALPALAMLATALTFARVRGVRLLGLALALTVPSLLTGSIYLWTFWGAHNYFGASAPHEGWGFVPVGFLRAFRDFYLGTTHNSFWGRFGWLDTPLVIGTPLVMRIIRLVILVVSLGILALTLVRLKRTTAAIVRLARRGRWRTALRLVVGQPCLNSYFLFTVLMFVLYVRLDNRFGAQGRNWLPLILPIFLTGIQYAPQALRGRRARLSMGLGVLVGLTIYSAAGAVYGPRTVRARFYDSDVKSQAAHGGYNGRMNIDKVLDTLSRDPHASFDVAEVALELARDEYPTLDVEAYLSELAGMAHEARTALRGNLSARVAALCRYLFHDMGFRGNYQEYYDPRNSYFNQVLDRRTGIPISLSAVAIAIGARAGLEIVGVGLPGHFVVKAVAGPREVLFDPFHGGRLLTPEDCERLIERATGRPFRATPASLEALPLGLMVLRMLNNLKAVYFREGEFARAVRVLQRLRQLDPTDPLHQRDLGIGFLHAGQPGNAIDHLTAYLESAPPTAEVETIRPLLALARAEVAKWN